MDEIIVFIRGIFIVVGATTSAIIIFGKDSYLILPILGLSGYLACWGKD